MISVGAVGTAGFGALTGVGANKSVSITESGIKGQISPTAAPAEAPAETPAGPTGPVATPAMPSEFQTLQADLTQLDQASAKADKIEFSVIFDKSILSDEIL